MSIPSKPTKLSPKQAREELWRSGDELTFLLDTKQKEIWEAYKANKVGAEIVALFCRQFGKSFSLLAIAQNECRTRPGITVTFVAPRLKQGKKIVRANFTEIFRSCPKELRPEFKTQESEWHFPNGSKLELVGFNAGEVESSRGPKSHLILCDEAGFYDAHEFDYGINSVLYPKLNSTRGTMLMCSTLPKSSGHPYWEKVKKARYEKRIVEANILECPRYTKEDIDNFAERVGGYESIDFRREYMNEAITDDEFAVIPEATEDRMQKIVQPWQQPAVFDKYVSMDIGFKDLTFIVFGYYDFLNNKVVIEDEITIKGKKVTTKLIHDLSVDTEKRLWGETSKPYLRVGDNNNLILLNELTTDYNYPIIATAKDDKNAAINKLRLLVQNDQIAIHPRCKELIFHLKNATWNNSKTSFERSPDGAHYDGVDALVYLVRNIQFNKNPYPSNYFQQGTLIWQDRDANLSDFHKHVRDMFNPFRKNK